MRSLNENKTLLQKQNETQRQPTTTTTAARTSLFACATKTHTKITAPANSHRRRGFIDGLLEKKCKAQRRRRRRQAQTQLFTASQLGYLDDDDTSSTTAAAAKPPAQSFELARCLCFPFGVTWRSQQQQQQHRLPQRAERERRSTALGKGKPACRLCCCCRLVVVYKTARAATVSVVATCKKPNIH